MKESSFGKKIGKIIKETSAGIALTSISLGGFTSNNSEVKSDKDILEQDKLNRTEASFFIEANNSTEKVVSEIKVEYEDEKNNYNESIRINIDKKISEYIDFYNKMNIELPSNFKEQMQLIWENNIDEIKKEVKEKGFNEVLLAPPILNSKQLAEKIRVWNMWNQYTSNSTSGYEDLKSQNTDKFRLILVHNTQDLVDRPDLEKTRNIKGQDVPLEEILTIEDYLIFQGKYFSETGNFLDESGYSWMSTKDGSRLVYAFCVPSENNIVLESEDINFKNERLGFRPAHIFLGDNIKSTIIKDKKEIKRDKKEIKKDKIVNEKISKISLYLSPKDVESYDFRNMSDQEFSDILLKAESECDKKEKTEIEKVGNYDLVNYDLVKKDTTQYLSDKFISEVVDNIKKDKKECKKDIVNIMIMIEKAKIELINHVGSNEYLEKLAKEMNVPKKIALLYQKVRINNIKNLSYCLKTSSEIEQDAGENSYAYYTKGTNKITLPYTIDFNDKESLRFLYESIIHEISHEFTIGNIGIYGQTKDILTNSFTSVIGEKFKQTMYFSCITELIVRKNILDLEMEKLGIKKYGEKFEKKHYETLIRLEDEDKLSKDSKEFIKHIKVENFIRIMNEIAENKEIKGSGDYYNPEWHYGENQA